MVLSAQFDSESAPTARFVGSVIFETDINQDAIYLDIPSLIIGRKKNITAPLNTVLYLHKNTAPEPTSDGHIKITSFDESKQTYTCGSGICKSFTSSTGIFSQNQTFGVYGVKWIVKWQGRYVTKTAGYSPWIRFLFYKRNSSNVDTFLFQTAKYDLPFLPTITGQTNTFIPSGSVTTSDRLRIRVKFGESLPS